MGWEDRQYGFERRGFGSNNIFWSILTGSFPIGSFRGIHIRVHASLPILIGSEILLDWNKNFPIQARIISMAMLFGIVLLHEFGHCFAARAVGGSADQILIWPLGGLAFTDPPHRPLPTFITVVAGPAVNVVILMLCVAAIWLLGGGLVSLNPFNTATDFKSSQVGYYVFWLHLINYWLLLFNLLPIFPLDCGQMLQCALWPRLGYRRATHIACIVGIVGASLLAIYSLIGWHLIVLLVAISCLLYCYQRLTMLRDMGEEEWSSEYDGIDYAASLKLPQHFETPKRKRRVSKWKLRRLRRKAMEEAAEQERLDAILAKVSAHGMKGLTWSERRVLRRATERQRRQDEIEATK